MNKINWKIRLQNPAFWVEVALAIAAPVLGYFGLTGADITSWAVLGQTLLAALGNPYVLLLAAVSVYNALLDPTTPGLGDSARALQYTAPGRKGK